MAPVITATLGAWLLTLVAPVDVTVALVTEAILFAATWRVRFFACVWARLIASRTPFVNGALLLARACWQPLTILLCHHIIKDALGARAWALFVAKPAIPSSFAPVTLASSGAATLRTFEVAILWAPFRTMKTMKSFFTRLTLTALILDAVCWVGILVNPVVPLACSWQIAIPQEIATELARIRAFQIAAIAPMLP